MKILPLWYLTLFYAVLLPGTGLAQIVPILPNINTANVLNVTNSPYNATTSSTDNSNAIETAIIAAAAASGGGTVEIPGPGTYMSSPISLRKFVNLQIDAGATLKFLPFASYPGAGSASPPYCISGTNLTDVEISGSGTIDGNGAAWWAGYSASNVARPYMVYLNKCQRVLYQGVTLQNPPKMHIVFKNWMGNVTIQGITINTTAGNAANTDGIDLIGTNCLIQNCSIAAGDDNIAIGSSTVGAIAAGILVTNCSFGVGHGMSIGSNTQGGVSNLTVINCSFNGTQNGIRLKSDDAPTTAGGGVGGMVQNIYYYNLTMTNILFFPISISSYYNYIDPPIISLSQAAGTNAAPVTGTTVSWQNIVISNLNSTYTSGHNNSGLILWGRTELPITNFTLINSKIKSSSSFQIYNAYGVQIVDSQITFPSGTTAYSIYNAGVTLTNSTTTNSALSVTGQTSTNSLALYNAPVNINASDLYGANPISVSGCIVSNSTSLTLPSTTVVNYALGTSPTQIAVNGSLELDSPTLNIATNAGFGVGTYTLFSYTSSSPNITPVLGTTPAGFNYTLTNNTSANQVNLLVTSTGPSGTAPTITNQPASQGFYNGDTATLVSGASGTAPLLYQWYFNTNNILAAGTNSTLILTNLQTTNAGAYDVIVTNASGSATSAVANLTVILPPKFASTILSGGNLMASGNGGLPGSNYVVLGTTNVALPVSQWTRLATNPFDGSGNFSFTNATGTNTQGYFRMQLP